MRNRPRNSIRFHLTLDPTSSLNKFFLCECDRKFEKKELLVKHVANCSGKPVVHYCDWCKISFKNRGNLVQHAKYLHGDESYRLIPKQSKTYQCEVCEARYDSMWKLKYHIRASHFNLLANVSNSLETKQVNQVWFEQVLNSKNVVEITKTGPNTLVMKCAPNSVKPSLSSEPDKVDLHSIYPTGRKKIVDVMCKICKKFYRNRDLKKHIQEAHQKDFTKHKCNNCGMTFKRSYIFLKHVCNKVDGRSRTKKVAGVTQYGKCIKIASVSSLYPVELD